MTDNGCNQQTLLRMFVKINSKRYIFPCLIAENCHLLNTYAYYKVFVITRIKKKEEIVLVFYRFNCYNYIIVFSKMVPATGYNKKQFEYGMKKKREVRCFLQFSKHQIHQHVFERFKLLRTALLSYESISSIIDWFTAFSKFARTVASCFCCNPLRIACDCASGKRSYFDISYICLLFYYRYIIIIM